MLTGSLELQTVGPNPPWPFSCLKLCSIGPLLSRSKSQTRGNKHRQAEFGGQSKTPHKIKIFIRGSSAQFPATSLNNQSELGIHDIYLICLSLPVIGTAQALPILPLKLERRDGRGMF